MMVVVMMTSMKTTIITMKSAVAFVFTSELFIDTLELSCSCDILAVFVWARREMVMIICVGPFAGSLEL